ncbi:hypothetical protein MYX65_07605 [Acidobacteria bacterium AH-259-L09]|nr:hypothetical protein [Acidobacteria bacterium AH-259-L09]
MRRLKIKIRKALTILSIFLQSKAACRTWSKVSLPIILFLLFGKLVAQDSTTGVFILTAESEFKLVATTTTAGDIFESVSLVHLNTSNDMMVLRGTVDGKVALYLYREGQLNLIVRDGDPVPGDPTKTLTQIGSGDLNSAGECLFKALVGDFRGILKYSQGNLSTIAIEGQPSPDGSLFQFVNPEGITSTGDVIFGGQTLAGLLATYQYRAATGTISTLFSSATKIPDDNAGRSIGKYEVRMMNDRGDLLIRQTQNTRIELLFFDGQLYALAPDVLSFTKSGDVFLHTATSVALRRTKPSPGCGSNNNLAYFHFDGGPLKELMGFSRDCFDGGASIGADSLLVIEKQQKQEGNFITLRSEALWFLAKDRRKKLLDRNAVLPGGSKIDEMTTFNDGRSDKHLLLVKSPSIKEGIQYDGLFVIGDGVLNHVVSVGQPVPGGGGIAEIFVGGVGTSMNSLGDFIFTAKVFAGPASFETFRFSNNELSAILYDGLTTNLGTLESILYGVGPQITDSGSIVFTATFFPSELTVTPQRGTTYPQLALGGGFEGILIVSNKSNSSWEGTILLRQGNDQNWSSPWAVNGSAQTASTSFDITLGPDATKKFVLTGDAQAQTGYLLVAGRNGFTTSSITPSFFYNFFSNGRLVDSTGVPASSESTRFVFPVEKTETVNTGFAWAPSSVTSPFQITLTLFDTDGSQVQKKTLTYEGHLARFFTEIFDSVLDGFIGKVLVESGNDIHLTVLRLEFTAGGFQLTSVPPG